MISWYLLPSTPTETPPRCSKWLSHLRLASHWTSEPLGAWACWRVCQSQSTAPGGIWSAREWPFPTLSEDLIALGALLGPGNPAALAAICCREFRALDPRDESWLHPHRLQIEFVLRWRSQLVPVRPVLPVLRSSGSRPWFRVRNQAKPQPVPAEWWRVSHHIKRSEDSRLPGIATCNQVFYVMC